LQNFVREDWEKKSSHQPDSHLQLIYLFEELGEMAEAIRIRQLAEGGQKKRNKAKADLAGEMGDVLIALATIANHYGIDLDAACLKSKKKITKRHARGF